MFSLKAVDFYFIEIHASEYVFSFSHTLRVLCDFWVSKAYTWTIFLFMSSLCTIKIPTKQSQFSSTIFVTVFKTISWQLLGFLRIVSYHSWLSLEVKWKWLSHVQLCDPMDCSPPGSSVHRILQATITGVGICSLLRGIFPIGDQT